VSDIRERLCECGVKLVQAGLSAGAGGNMSARDGNTIWMTPSGYALNDLTPDGLCKVLLESGDHVSGDAAPTTELSLHLAVYRTRGDVNAVFHSHPPWLTGVISAGVPFRALTTESVGYLGRVIHLPYAIPQSEALAAQVEDASCMHETLLLPNHGVVVLGTTCTEALHRSLVAEDTAKSIMAASLVGSPQFLSEKQISQLNGDA
jgi:L-fuculose-phosphate aldolase